MLNEDYKEILQYLVDEQVKFLLVGAYSYPVHSRPHLQQEGFGQDQGPGGCGSSREAQIIPTGFSQKRIIDLKRGDR